MASLDDVLKNAVPGGVTKPLMVALLALWASGALTKGSSTSPGAASSGTAGDLLNGLGGLIKTLQTGGLGDIINSWVGTGPNKTITPGQLGNALGPDILKTLSDKSGLSQDELTAALAKVLPVLIDNLTPRAACRRTTNWPT